MLETTGKRTEHTVIGGMPVAIASEQDLVGLMLDDCARHRRGELEHPISVFDCNGQALSMYAADPEYAAAIDSADLVHADGQFVVWMSAMSGRRIPGRSATTDLIHAAARAAAERGMSFYLLGGSEKVNRRCAQELQRRYPGLVISGRHNGYFGETDEDKVVNDINESGADVVWIGLGKPKEQSFVIRNKDRLRAAWLVTCGGCFNYVVGEYRRAPLWMQSAGLEWMHRMATGPRYLMKRYLLTIPHAIGLVLYERLTRNSRRGRGAAS